MLTVAQVISASEQLPEYLTNSDRYRRQQDYLPAASPPVGEIRQQQDWITQEWESFAIIAAAIDMTLKPLVARPYRAFARTSAKIHVINEATTQYP